MKRLLSFVGLVALVLTLALPVPSAAAVQPLASQDYTVLVGLENAHQGIDVMAFFPSSVIIHAGDTVHWKLNSNEIHTVTFGYDENAELPEAIVPAAAFGFPADPSPLILNPAIANPSIPAGGEYTGGPASSGLMSPEGGAQEFSLTFPEPGTYLYVCLIHGWEMSGYVVVKGPNEPVPSPQKSMAQGNKEMAQALARVPAVRKAAMQQIEPPVVNADGTLTHYIKLGYHDEQIDLMRFFPSRTIVHPGDTVVWEMSETNDAPHTVTFLNGEPAPGLFIAVAQPSGPPVLYVDPATLFPYPSSSELTRNGIYNSGVMLPIPGTSFTLTIGDIKPGPEPYLCLLHDESGMKGSLVVVPRPGLSQLSVLTK
jgi:plastocyanin